MLENYRDLFILSYAYQYSASASPVRRGVQQGPMPPRGELPAHRVPLRRPGLGSRRCCSAAAATERAVVLKIQMYKKHLERTSF